jgi:hypothetical protein
LSKLAAASKLIDKKQIIEAEKILLQTLGWNALSATHLQFAECYTRLGVIFPSDKIRGQHWNQSDLRAVKAMMESLSRLCAFGKYCCNSEPDFPRLTCFRVTEYSFLRFDQATVAGAIVARAREAQGVESIWTSDCIRVTGSSFEDIQDCYQQIRALDLASAPITDHLQSEMIHSPKSVCCLASSFSYKH